MRLANENTNRGYTRIRDVIFTLGHEIGRTTVRRILAEDGIEPAPERRKHMPWATFLRAHWGAIAAMDFFKVEVTTLTGPVRYTVLVVMDLKTRQVEVAGIVREAYEKEVDPAGRRSRCKWPVSQTGTTRRVAQPLLPRSCVNPGRSSKSTQRAPAPHPKTNQWEKRSTSASKPGSDQSGSHQGSTVSSLAETSDGIESISSSFFSAFSCSPVRA